MIQWFVDCTTCGARLGPTSQEEATEFYDGHADAHPDGSPGHLILYDREMS